MKFAKHEETSLLMVFLYVLVYALLNRERWLLTFGNLLFPLCDHSAARFSIGFVLPNAPFLMWWRWCCRIGGRINPNVGTCTHNHSRALPIVVNFFSDPILVWPPNWIILAGSEFWWNVLEFGRKYKNKYIIDTKFG